VINEEGIAEDARAHWFHQWRRVMGEEAVTRNRHPAMGIFGYGITLGKRAQNDPAVGRCWRDDNLS
jgi:hypothetical protein